ncbi:MAG: CD1871A family CXXC motif-containing protein [Eubacteriales bacterium]|nr:CD1871A family CXXC motif-containing protein [Eubacteriales bacterium]
MNRNKKRILQLMMGLAAVGMIGYGVYRGEVSIVLNKAINICLECIGLG